MLLGKLQKARNFSQTAVILLKSYVQATGWRGYATLIGTAGMGFIQPLPLAFLAQIAMAASKGSATVWFPGVTLTLSTAFYIAIGFVLLEVLISYAIEWFVLVQNTKWQDHMHSAILEGAPRVARPYFNVHNTGAASGREYVQLINRAVISASLFSRIVSRALKDGTAALVALAILTWLDISTLAIIAAMTCLFVPFFAKAAAVAATSRLLNRNMVRDALPSAAKRAERDDTGEAGPPPSALNATRSGADLNRNDSRSLYALPNQIKRQLNKFRLLSGLSLVAILLSIFIWNGGDVQNLLQDKLIYFAVLLVFLRSVRGLTTTFAQFSQNYNALAILKTFLAPRLKDLAAAALAPTRQSGKTDKSGKSGSSSKSGDYRIADTAGKSITISPGQPVYVLMPPVRFNFQLVGLSNAMLPCAPATVPAAISLTLFKLNSHGSGASAAAYPATGPATGPVVVTEDDWLQAKEAVLQLKSCTFIALSEPAAGRTRDTALPLVVLEGDAVLAVGRYAQLYDAWAGKIGSANLPPQPVLDDDIDQI